MKGCNVLPYGPQGALIETPAHRTLQVAQALRERADFLEVVPAEQSILIRLPLGMRWQDVRDVVDALPTDLPMASGRDIEIPVRYDGEDLTLVALATGMTVDEVVATHSGCIYTAAFAGFAPGFVYCTGLDARLQLPRRPSPRTAVPAGSVAIADAYTAIYPTPSPGGWHLLGTTDLTLFDIEQSEPALIRPGDRVRFTVRTS